MRARSGGCWGRKSGVWDLVVVLEREKSEMMNLPPLPKERQARLEFARERIFDMSKN